MQKLCTKQNKPHEKLSLNPAKISANCNFFKPKTKCALNFSVKFR